MLVVVHRSMAEGIWAARPTQVAHGALLNGAAWHDAMY
jgi:hypothetical protein